MSAWPFVCLIRIHLHFPENGSLKGKRKELQSLKAQLQRRFGASVAETDHHDLWQRSDAVGRAGGPGGRRGRGRRDSPGALRGLTATPTERLFERCTRFLRRS